MPAALMSGSTDALRAEGLLLNASGPGMYLTLQLAAQGSGMQPIDTLPTSYADLLVGQQAAPPTACAPASLLPLKCPYARAMQQACIDAAACNTLLCPVQVGQHEVQIDVEGAVTVRHCQPAWCLHGLRGWPVLVGDDCTLP